MKPPFSTHRLLAAALAVAALAVALMAGACDAGGWSTTARGWSNTERAAIASLSLDQLPPLPPDPSNAWADDPAAAAFGRILFFDPRLSANGAVSCASCHQPQRFFTDGRPLGQGLGAFHRNTMSLVGVAWSPWLNWDGKADSLWSHALLPLENPVEHGLDRTALAHLIARDHAQAYEAIFGALPALDDATRFPAHAGPHGDSDAQAAWEAMAPTDREAIDALFVHVGKALGAWQRTLTPQSSRFDRWAAALAAGERPAADARLSSDEQAGLRLFVGKAQCLNCHNGPLFTNNEFHNTGVPPTPGLALDHGRAAALPLLDASPFTCLGPWSDAAPDDCSALLFTQRADDSLEGAFRTPSLRNVAETAPYMHAGQIATLEQVLEHYNQGGSPALVGHNDLPALGLSQREMAQIVAFLRTLTQDEAPDTSAAGAN
jgi:cytochrome c peroxidase